MDEVHLPGWLCLSDITDEWLRQQGGWDNIEQVVPWGWDARLVHQLRKRGCPDRLLPTTEQLDTIRHLSSRQTAVRILPMLTDKFKSWWVEGDENDLDFDLNLDLNPNPNPNADSSIDSDVDVNVDVNVDFDQLLFKAPWSCSGRGVFTYNEARIRKVLREQGGIEVEPLYDRVADFAMEFRCESGRVEFLGYSTMLNDGYHGGNLVMADEQHLALLTQYVSEEEVQNIRTLLIYALSREIAPHYSGPLGVDQMVVRHPQDGYQLHPCVEINLRHTMGHVAIDRRCQE